MYNRRSERPQTYYREIVINGRTEAVQPASEAPRNPASFNLANSCRPSEALAPTNSIPRRSRVACSTIAEVPATNAQRGAFASIRRENERRARCTVTRRTTALYINIRSFNRRRHLRPPAAHRPVTPRATSILYIRFERANYSGALSLTAMAVVASGGPRETRAFTQTYQIDEG